MTQPRNARAAGSNRYYQWRQERYWSVTTIIGGGVPKPALLPWGIKSVAEGAVAERAVLDAMLEKCETPDECAKGDFCGTCDQAIRWLKGIPYAKRDKAADLGSYLHAATEAYVLGKPFPKWPVLVKPRMDAFVQFLADYEPVYEATEASVYNRTERYAGTLDAIATIGGAKILLDMKSGKAVYPEVALQLAAYRYAEFIGLPDGSEAPMHKVDGCAALHLSPQGTYELIEVQAGPDELKFFLYAREVFRWQEDASKSVLVGPMKLPSSEGQAALGALLADAKGATV